MRWKKKSSILCQFCDVEETIQHFLFSCTYAKTIWQDLEQITATNIDLQDVILSDSLNHAEMFVISLIAFFIYKEWLLCSLDNRPRLNNANLIKKIPNIKYKIEVYKSLGWIDINALLFNIVSFYTND